MVGAWSGNDWIGKSGCYINFKNYFDNIPVEVV